jgi:hypothetical protein
LKITVSLTIYPLACKTLHDLTSSLAKIPKEPITSEFGKTAADLLLLCNVYVFVTALQDVFELDMHFRADPWRMSHLGVKMKRILGSLLTGRLFTTTAGLFVILATTSAHADGIPAFSFTSATFATTDSATAELGYAFTTGSGPLAVNSLGYINDGFNGTHVVEIFNMATHLAVPGAIATVTTVGGGPTSNTFTSTDLASPVTLAANTQYQIISQFFPNEHYFYHAAGFTSYPGITLDITVFDDYGNPPALPTFATGTYGPTVPGDFGPNFTIVDPGATSVPELSSIYLVASGLITFGVARLRRH